MKLKHVFLAIFLGVAFSPAFAATTSTEQTQNPNVSSQDVASIGWVIVVDKSEIGMASEVLKRNDLNKKVKDYAEFLKKQHTENLKDALKLSIKIKEKPVFSQETVDMKKKAEEAEKNLSKMDDKQLQVNFVNDMVAGHQQALNKLDDLIKTASNSDVKKFLEGTRKHVERHLEIAKKIQTELKA